MNWTQEKVTDLYRMGMVCDEAINPCHLENGPFIFITTVCKILDISNPPANMITEAEKQFEEINEMNYKNVIRNLRRSHKNLRK